MRAASRSCCGWAGTGRCTASRWSRRGSVRCSAGGRCCWASCSTSSCRSAAFCLRGFGLKLGETTKSRFAGRVRELAAGQAMLEAVVEPMLRAREALRTEAAALHQRMLALHQRMLAVVREHEVCRRLMTVPGVGAVVGLTFVAAVDDPARFRRSKDVGAHFGLTPKRCQSGETDVVGGITRAGDASVRVPLYEAANVLLTRGTRFSSLKRWAVEVAKRRGARRAKVALARKLGAVLHRLWVDGTEFRWGKEPAVTA